ncbi:MAG: hypothetical protein R2851_05305 [Caldilineaceae bacterium]
MNPENRTVLQVSIEDAAEADRTFDMLMGSSVPPHVASSRRMPTRRNWIFRHPERETGRLGDWARADPDLPVSRFHHHPRLSPANVFEHVSQHSCGIHSTGPHEFLPNQRFLSQIP